MKKLQSHLAWIVPLLSLAGAWATVHYQVGDLIKWRDSTQTKIEDLMQWKFEMKGRFEGYQRARENRGR